MGYLDNSSITVDAILTKKGRQLLARGRDEFKITQFALADDEIDYDLWNNDHTLGTAYYGVVIENMPIIEALPDETQMMKYKLVTLPSRSTRIPVIAVQNRSILLSSGGTASIRPYTRLFRCYASSRYVCTRISKYRFIFNTNYIKHGIVYCRNPTYYCTFDSLC